MSEIKKALLLLIFLSISIGSTAQNNTSDDDVTIHFMQHSTWTRDNFEVEIERTTKSVKIKYSIFEEPPILAVKNDTAIQTLAKKLREKSAAGIEDTKIMGQLSKLLERHNIYHKDSIELAVSENIIYNNSLMGFARSDEKTLAKGNESRTMDVDFTTCNITVNGTIRSINGTVDQTVALNSAIIKFIKQTINLNQGDKIATVLKIREKYGY